TRLMEISRRDWALAMLGALVLHFLLLTGVWLARQPGFASQNAPRGVMVSLDNLDAGPPLASINDMPIETPSSSKDLVPEAAAPAADSVQAPVAPAPKAAPEVSAASNVKPPSASAQDGPNNTAKASSNGPYTASPAIASAVTVQPSDTLTAIR